MFYKILFVALLACAAVFSRANFAFAKDYVTHMGLSAPVDFALDKDGNLYVSEWGADRVVRFDKDGNKEAIITGVRNPAGLAFAQDGVLYIAGYGDNAIHAWDSKNGLREIAGGFSSPTGMIVDSDGSIIIANRDAGEVVRLFADGSKKVISCNHKTPVGIAKLPDGSIFVSCYGGSVDLIEPSGKMRSLQTSLSTPGVGIIAAGPDSVLVVDYGAGRIARVDKTGAAEIIAGNLPSPVALGKSHDGQILAGCWGDGSIHAIGEE